MAKEYRVSKEAHAYTAGLKIKRTTSVSRTRRLPIPGEVCVNVGEKVNHDTIVARTWIRGDPEIVNVATMIGAEDEDLPKYMTKTVGDKITKNEIIAANNELFGLIKKEVRSPVDGIIESISEATGQVIIRGSPVPVEVDAYVPGKVVEVTPRLGAVVETNAALIQGIFGIGGENHGSVKLAVDTCADEISEDCIASDDRGTVLVGGSLVTLEALRKAAETKVSCIVAGSVQHKDITAFMGEEIGVAITGQEAVGLTVIITEGFGKMRMSQRTFDLLKDFEGYTASVNGATQIRAGVLRPEIIIPHEKNYEQMFGDHLTAGMVSGTPVRIIRQPYFGALGKVVDLPVELQKVQSESYVRVLNVELEDGRIVTIPRANVEIIEE